MSDAGSVVLPSDLLKLWERGVRPVTAVAVDTETSGLFVDDGARVSTVSLAFLDVSGTWAGVLGAASYQWDAGVWTVASEPVTDDQELPIVSFAWPFDQGVQGTGKAEDDGYATLWPDAANLPEAEWVALLEWLGLVGEATGLVFHNAKFDLHMLESGCRRWPGVGRDFADVTVWDTQNGVSLLYPTRVVINAGKGPQASTSLKPTSKVLWGEDEGDEQKVIKEYLRKHKLPAGRWDLMPWSVIARYAEDDARKTIRLYLRQSVDISSVSWLDGQESRLSVFDAMERRMRTTLMLTRIEQRGLPFDTKGALEAARMMDRRRLDLVAQLPFKPATVNAGKKYWFGPRDEGGLGLVPYATTAKGQPSVTELELDKMIKDNVPGAETWRDIQKVSTANDRWYTGWASMVGSDGRLRCGIRQNGTVSGRFSVERVQLQAIPHDYRLSAYSVLEGIPTPRELIGSGVPAGFKLWELDLAQAELRVAALYAGCQSMLDLIEAGEDLHGVTALELFPVGKESSEWGFYRNIAKRANFGLIFGSGWETFQKDLEKQTGIRLSDSEAQRIVKSWNALYPEFKRAIYSHQGTVESRMKSGSGYLQMSNGERRWFVPGEETHKSFNQRVQPNLAQFGIDWWLWSEQRLMDLYGHEPVVTSEGYVGRIGMVLTVHDSQVLLLPDDAQALAVVQEIADYAVSLWAERFPGVSGGVDAKQWTKAA